MAGRGAAPKDPSQRRNRTPPMRGEWVDLEPLDAPILAPADPGWSEHVTELWNAWRSDPVTSQYSESDRAAVREFARRFDDLAPNEQRLRMDGFGLTPKGKRDLRWRVPGQQVAERDRQRTPSSGDSGRRSRLSVVK